MWIPATRLQHRRDRLRFASDSTNAEWAELEPFVSTPTSIGRPAAWELCDVLNAIFYVLRGGIP